VGWKKVKEHYRITHIVQVNEAGICIGSGYIPEIIVISLSGLLVKRDDFSGRTGALARYKKEMEDDPSTLKCLVLEPDVFDSAITVYTFDGARIIEKKCEELGWPNVTHDGCVMYENAFSTNRTKVIKWAKDSAASRVESGLLRVRDAEQALTEARARLAQYEADRLALELLPSLPRGAKRRVSAQQSAPLPAVTLLPMLGDDEIEPFEDIGDL
jgi:hypothetical protein